MEIKSATQQDAEEYIQQLQKLKQELGAKDALIIAIIDTVIYNVRINPDHLKILPTPKGTAEDWKKYAEAQQSSIVSGREWIVLDTKLTYQKNKNIKKNELFEED